MTEAMETIKVPNGEMRFEFGAQQFTAGVVSLERDLRRLADDAIKAGKSQYDYLDAVIAHVKELFGADLTLSQADALSIKISEAVARWKQGLLGALNTALQPTVTGARGEIEE